jgi:hypothetical protein
MEIVKNTKIALEGRTLRLVTFGWLFYIVFAIGSRPYCYFVLAFDGWSLKLIFGSSDPSVYMNWALVRKLAQFEPKFDEPTCHT